jgi:hypothetical protein
MLLGGGAWLAQRGLTQLALERQQSAQVRAELQNARGLLPEVEKRERLVQAVQNMTRQVDSMGLDPAQWQEHRLRRTPAPATRLEAVEFLGTLKRNSENAVFVADIFEIATVTENAGLFHTPQSGDLGLTLSVSGTFHFRTASASTVSKGHP